MFYLDFCSDEEREIIAAEAILQKRLSLKRLERLWEERGANLPCMKTMENSSLLKWRQLFIPEGEMFHLGLSSNAVCSIPRHVCGRASGIRVHERIVGFFVPRREGFWNVCIFLLQDLFSVLSTALALFLLCCVLDH